MKKLLMMIFLMGMLSLHAKTTQLTPIPATQGLVAKEALFIFFSNLTELRQALIVSDPATLDKVLTKLAPLVDRSVYPSQLAHLMFELAFVDGEPMRLTSQQRTDNMGYLLSSLGRGDAEAVLQLYAFYYGYSFEHFVQRVN